MVEFKKEDVTKVAKALIEECLNWNHGDGYICEHCYDGTGRYAEDEKDFKHALTCPVLIAQDLLTGAEL